MSESIEQDLQPPQNVEIPDQLPLLPVRDIVVFPYMVLPLFVGRDMSIKAIEAALAGNRMIFLATQKALDVENPAPEDIHTDRHRRHHHADAEAAGRTDQNPGAGPRQSQDLRTTFRPTLLLRSHRQADRSASRQFRPLKPKPSCGP